jgi:hypothetical protein
VMEILSEHTCQGWPRSLPPHRPAWLFLELTRRSSISSTRCSTSTPSGSR